MSYWKISASSNATRSGSAGGARAWKSELSMVALRGAGAHFEGVLENVAVMKPSVVASPSASRCPTTCVRDRRSSPSAMHEAQQSPGFSRSTWLRSSGRFANASPDPEIEFEAAKQAVHGVVAADDHFDGRPKAARSSLARRQPQIEAECDRRQRRRGHARCGSRSRGNVSDAAPISGEQPELEMRCAARVDKPRNGGLE